MTLNTSVLMRTLLIGLLAASSAQAASDAPAAAAAPAPAATPSDSVPPNPRIKIPKVTMDAKIHAPEANTVGDMISAIRQDDCPRLGEILKTGANPNQFDSFGYTPLTVAALDKRPLCIKLLTDAGADINIPSAGGWTPLIGAAMSGAGGDLLAQLLAKGADINARNQWGCTALYYAAGFGALGTVNYLLDKGAAYPGTGEECPTPLKIAELRGYADLITRFKLLEGKAPAKGETTKSDTTKPEAEAAKPADDAAKADK